MIDPSQRARFGAALAAYAAALLLSACGADAPSPDAARDSGEQAAADNMVNAFSFEADGDAALAAMLETAQLTLTGGCSSGSPLSIGFMQGMPNEETFFRFAFDSAEPVANGYAGTVTLSNVTWDNGVAIPDNLPADTPVRVPIRFDGEGTLTIASQTDVGLAGRMVGSVDANVSNAAGQRAAISAGFDIDLACGL